MTTQAGLGRRSALAVASWSGMLVMTAGCGLGDLGADMAAWDKARDALDDETTGGDATQGDAIEGDAIEGDAIEGDGSSPADATDDGQGSGSDAPGDVGPGPDGQGDAGADALPPPECVTPADCEGEVPACQRWSCAAGSCAPVPLPQSPTVTCALDAPCQPTGVCLAGACTAAVADPCDDGDPCTHDACVTSGCDHWPNMDPCDDSDPCTVADTCTEGNCEGSPKDCDDANTCTQDACAPGGACAHLPVAASCTDDNLCTTDTCAEGKCQTKKIVCDDGIFCSDDTCWPEKGCVVHYNTIPCDDGDPCTLGDRCKLLKCVGVPALFAKVTPPSKGFKVAVWGNALVRADGSATLYGALSPGGDDPEVWWAQRLDPTGKVIWTREVATGVRGLPEAATLSDGGHLLAGSQDDATKKSTDGRVSRVDGEGKVVQTWTYGGAFKDELHAIAVVDSSTWLLAGSTVKSTGGPAQAWLLRTTWGGKVAAEALPEAGRPSALFAAVTATAAAPAVVCGETAEGKGEAHALLLAAGADLGVRWRRTRPKDDACHAIARGIDGGLLWGGTSGAGHPFVEALSPGGAWRWRSTWEDAGGAWPPAIAPLPDGSVVALTVRMIAPWKLAGRRLSNHGAVLDTFTWGQAKVTAVRRAGLSPSGRLWVTGAQGTSIDLLDALVLRVSPWGQTTCAAAGACGAPLPGVCDDGNPCTDDGCSPATGCAVTPTTAPCEDGDPCTGGDTCAGGKCTPGHARMGQIWYEPELITPAKPFVDDVMPIITRMPDGGLTLAAAHPTTGKKTSTRLLRLDPGAKVLWKKSQLGVGDEVPFAMVPAPGGGVVVVGRRDGGGFATWTTAAGGVKATVTLKGSGGQLTAVKLGAGGAAVAIGQRVAIAGAAQVKAGWWVRVSGKTVQQEATWSEPGVALEPRKLVAAGGGSWAVAGRWTPAGAGPKAWLSRVDAQGKRMWQKTWGAVSAVRPIAALARMPSGGFVLVATAGQSLPKASVTVWRTSPSGDLLWTSKPNKGKSAWAGAATVLPGGPIVVVGNLVGSGGNASAATVFRLSGAGELLETRALSTKGIVLPNDATLTAEGDIAIAIFSEPKQAGLYWPAVLWIDPWGHESCETAGKCAAMTPGECVDGLPCTRDRCHPKAGCVFSADALRCDDGDACTTGDACQKGACKPGTPMGCDDGLQCTADACDKQTGCTHKPVAAGTPCTDGAPCSAGTLCVAGACAGGKPKDCDDGVACTLDACAPETGVCTNTPQKAACDDGLACTTDTCSAKLGCQHAADKTPCDDGVACTADTCDLKLGCQHAPQPAKCDDGVGCSEDVCDPKAGCGHVTDMAICGDGIACTADACDMKKDTCSHTPQQSACDDANACTTDACGAKGCTHTAKPLGQSCGGAGEVCSGGACVVPLFTRIAVGSDFSCAVSIEKGVVCWGSQGIAACGGASCPTPTPIKTLGDGQLLQLGAGEGHACAQRENELRCWGVATHGQVIPKQAIKLIGPTAIVKDTNAHLGLSLGARHTCVIDEGKETRCFGGPLKGQIPGLPAPGAMVDPTPVLVQTWPLSAVTANRETTCGIDDMATVWCVGSAAGVGNPNVSGATTAVALQVLSSKKPPVPLKKINALRRGPRLNLATAASTVLFAWGVNTTGYPGWKTGQANIISLPQRTVDAAAGNTHACAVDILGDVRCWGLKAGVVLGDPAAPLVAGKPTLVPGLKMIKRVSSWGDHTCALRVDGAIFCWGANLVGQCGSGTTGAWQKPTAVKGTLPGGQP